jgi:hypothetical protein
VEKEKLTMNYIFPMYADEGLKEKQQLTAKVRKEILLEEEAKKMQTILK